MWSRVWIVLALVAIVPWQVSSLHSDAGPWVPATRGELWPMPKTRTVKEDFYLLRPSNFDFRVSRVLILFYFHTMSYCQIILTIINLMQ